MLDMIKIEKERRLGRDNLYEFLKQCWHVIEPGVPFVPSWHLNVICDHLEAVSDGDIQRLLINIPPRHSKSTITVVWSVWEWITRPEEKFLCASYSGVLSIRDNLKARRLIESPWFQARYGDSFTMTSDQNQKGRFENDKTGYRLATSVGGTATGEGGTRLILDDPHGAQDAQSDAMRETALEWFNSVWATRLNTPKRDSMVTIMQRLHEKDISGHILEELGGWEHVCIPAEWDGNVRRTVLGLYDPRTVKGELICPERFGPEELTRLKQSLGAYGASGQLQQEPVPAGGGMIKTDKFKMWPAAEPLPQFEFVLQSYDTAFTEKTTGDPTGCTVWGVFTHKGDRNAMLIDCWDEHLSYPELRKRVIKDWSVEYGGTTGPQKGVPTRPRKPDRILVEAKASGQSLIQDLRLARVPVVAYQPGAADKIARAHQMTPTLEMGLLWIPESGKNNGQFVSWAADFIKQLAKFPRAEHDEYVDTTSQAVIYMKNEGWFILNTAKERDEDAKPERDKVNPYAA